MNLLGIDRGTTMGFFCLLVVVSLLLIASCLQTADNDDAWTPPITEHLEIRAHWRPVKLAAARSTRDDGDGGGGHTQSGNRPSKWPHRHK